MLNFFPQTIYRSFAQLDDLFGNKLDGWVRDGGAPENLENRQYIADTIRRNRLYTAQGAQFHFSYRKLTSLPEVIFTMSHTTTLDLRGNLLTHLSTEVGRMSRLMTLLLSGNPIEELPVELGNLKQVWSLELIDMPLTALNFPTDNWTALYRVVSDEKTLSGLLGKEAFTQLCDKNPSLIEKEDPDTILSPNPNPRNDLCVIRGGKKAQSVVTLAKKETDERKHLQDLFGSIKNCAG